MSQSGKQPVCLKMSKTLIAKGVFPHTVKICVCEISFFTLHVKERLSRMQRWFPLQFCVRKKWPRIQTPPVVENIIYTRGFPDCHAHKHTYHTHLYAFTEFWDVLLFFQLLDLCILDIHSLEFKYGVLAAAAFCHFVSFEVVQKVSGKNSFRISCTFAYCLFFFFSQWDFSSYE